MNRRKKKLQTFLKLQDGKFFSRKTINLIFRALLEPIAEQNPPAVIFSRLKNKDGFTSLIKRLEYCENVDMIDIFPREEVIIDDYIELEFVILNSPRYNFAFIWDYSGDNDKNYSPIYFAANSNKVNEIFEILQTNLKKDYRENFYKYKPERRENELLNSALINVLKKMNESIEEEQFASEENDIVDFAYEETDDRIRECAHEIKNQLSIIDIYTTIIEKKYDIKRETDVIRKAMSIISLELKKLQNYENSDLNEINLLDVVNESIKIFEEPMKTKGNKISLIDEIKSDITVWADENKLLSVFNNILKNANESTENDTIEFKLSLQSTSILIDITNHGKPIDDKDLTFIFQKGYTTKENGSGMGLYSCKNYLKSIKGNLELLVSNNEKTTFRIELPLI